MMRRSLLAVLVGAVALLIVAIAGGVSGRANALTRERLALAQRSEAESQLLEDYFGKADALVSLTARNQTFIDFYGLPGNQAARVRSDTPAMGRVNEALADLGQMYPDRTGEASFVDIGGAENARVVFGRPALPEQLAADVTDTPYFAPTFTLTHGVVYHSKPYLSTALNEWVVSSNTQVFMPDWVKTAIVHFEVRMESFRRRSVDPSGYQLLVVDADTGNVMIDISQPLTGGAPLGTPGDRRFAPLASGWGDQGLFSVGGRQASYHRVPAEVGNANHWYAVAVAPTATTALNGAGWLSGTVGLLSLMLIGYVLIMLRRSQAVLLAAANTDPLTGLQNRRRMVADLDRLCARATPDSPVLLILADLNGFKAFNDTFGHPAGDALLCRLARALSTALAGRGTGYRIGGDEFCVLAQPDRFEIEETTAAVGEALRDADHGVTITASLGTLLLPDETTDPLEAMRLVDARMYAHKRHRCATDSPQSAPPQSAHLAG